ncbi:hypothetical protein N9164_06110 [Draconibacterium sp.]|nr:hypothetical protein [Draconibacterium sp.]
MRILFTSILILVLALSSNAQNMFSVFRDSTDNAFDVSDFLITKKGLLPVPMLITEPAVGYGAALGLIFFHHSYENKKSPPSISGAFGALTENGSWGAGGFHAGFWKQDKIRYVGFVGKINVNIDYYGKLPNPVGFSMNSWILMQRIQFRLGETHFFAGAKYNYIPAHNKLDFAIDIPGFEGINFETNISEVSALLIYDSRNNVISPTKGILAQVIPVFSDTWLGGDSQYGKINSSIMGLQPLNEKWIIGGILMANSKLGDIPFYLKPFVQLRGVPFLKYQNNNIISFEAEAEWNIYKRWHLIGFAGLGNAFDKYESFNEGNSVFSGGGGFRYLLARKFGMKMGMDFAFSPDDFAFYVTMGHAWAF